MARAGLSSQLVIPDSEPDDVASSPAPRSRKPISPPTLTRQSSGAGQAGLTSLHASTPSRTSQGPPQKPASQDAKVNSLSFWPSGTAKSTTHDDVNSSTAHQQPANQRTPRNQTPKKGEVTFTKLEASLRAFSREIGVNHARLTARLIHDTWKRDAPEQQSVSKKDWFADVRLESVGPNTKSSEAMRIKTKVSTPL